MIEHDIIEGLYYIENYITNEEHNMIMNNIKNDIKEWNPVGSSKFSRKVKHYGYSYGYDYSGINKIEDIPDFYKNLVNPERINNYFPSPLINQEFEQLIINEYLPKQGIYPHIDHTKFFGSIIICLTVGSGINIEFSSNSHENIVNFYVKPCSLYIMTSKSRYNWKHGITKSLYDVLPNSNQKIIRNTRYSITFRTINK